MPRYYDTIRQVELSDGSTLPVGSYNSAMFVSTAHDTSHSLAIYKSPTAHDKTRYGVLKITAYSLVEGVAEIEITFGADGLAHPGNDNNSYRLKTFSPNMIPTITYRPGSSINNAPEYIYVTLTFLQQVSIVATLDCPGAVITTSAPIPTGDGITMQPLFAHPILIEDKDYGENLPSPLGQKGRIFFKRVQV